MVTCEGRDPDPREYVNAHEPLRYVNGMKKTHGRKFVVCLVFSCSLLSFRDQTKATRRPSYKFGVSGQAIQSTEGEIAAVSRGKVHKQLDDLSRSSELCCQMMDEVSEN